MAAIQDLRPLFYEKMSILTVSLRKISRKLIWQIRSFPAVSQVLGELNAFDKLTEQSVLLNIDELLTQVYVDNAPEASISGILLLVGLNQPGNIIGTPNKTLLIFENLIYNAFSFLHRRMEVLPYNEIGKEMKLLLQFPTLEWNLSEHLPHLLRRFLCGQRG